MNRLLIILALIGIFMSPISAWAQWVDSLPGQSAGAGGVNVRIAAVVNDNVISTVDLESRIRLAMLSSGLPETEEVVHHLLPQVLRGLIDEQLEMQEAKRADVTVSPEEIDKALEHIAKDNNLPTDMKSFVTAHGVPPEALISQVRAIIAWNKVIQRELRPRIDIGDDEVDSAIERIKANAGKEEYNVSEIFLAVDNPQDEDQVRQFADNLVEQLKQGTNFGAVARQFSQSTGAAQGGDIGWIQEGQLPTELNRALMTMEPHEINGPIRSANGFHILSLKEKRTIAASSPGAVTLGLQQAFRSYAGTTKDVVDEEAVRIRNTTNTCTNLQGDLTQRFPGWRVQDMGNVEMSKIPEWIAPKVRDLTAGKASEALPTDKGDLIFFVCDRHVPEGGIDRNTIVSSIGSEKLELQARRLLRDLRRNAYLDIKLSSES